MAEELLSPLVRKRGNKKMVMLSCTQHSSTEKRPQLNKTHSTDYGPKGHSLFAAPPLEDKLESIEKYRVLMSSCLLKTRDEIHVSAIL